MKLYSDEELAKILNRPIFRQIGTIADEMGMECFVVGGYVRGQNNEKVVREIR